MTERPHVLLLGGTSDARRLAAELSSAEARLRVTSSLAGRVTHPRLPAGEVRVGGFGGVSGLVDWLRAHRVAAIVDATHPFAAVMSRNAALAAAETGTPLLALRRPAWTSGPGDRWHEVDTPAEAAALLPQLGRRVFVTTGRGDLAAFTAAPELWYLIRSVDPPEPTDLPPHHELLLARGPFDLAAERETLRRHRIDVLLTKNSGGPATSPKLLAAREAGIPVVLRRRPATPPGVPEVPDVPGALHWLDCQLSH
ncbi:cobalt-precorrin-6A reductase [Streptomyces durbertensis]|uniref:Cobalt-precorrin-6A reductase n=1 Tax=Streptomyces durbertensis TaxID=2448886 RepID=A0ABR6EK18_9ACTN|nr:cobalt-precorrin-6A reductase [Streptomyces durbertensis]MBB1245679.1 cobalt-precorrin-6A reductase [Streptomyces durbertensis]